MEAAPPLSATLAGMGQPPGLASSNAWSLSSAAGQPLPQSFPAFSGLRLPSWEEERSPVCGEHRPISLLRRRPGQPLPRLFSGLTVPGGAETPLSSATIPQMLTLPLGIETRLIFSSGPGPSHCTPPCVNLSRSITLCF